MIKDLVKKALQGVGTKGSFAQNFAFVLSGTGLNIMVQVVVAPLLARIYGPEAYGIFAIFNAVCTNLALVATLRLPQAMLLPKDETDFSSLMRLSLLSSLVLSALLFIALFLVGDFVLTFFQAESLIDFFYLIPISVFLISLNQVLGQWQYRLSEFKKAVSIDTGVLIGVRIFNLVVGWISNGISIGLVAGDIVGKIFGSILSWKFIIRAKIKILFQSISWNQLKGTLFEYKQYPIYNLPGVWISMLSDQLPVFFFSHLFGLKTIGFLALATSMLDLPKRLLAYSVSSIFYKRAVELNRESDKGLQKFVSQMLYSFLILSLIPYTAVIVFGPELFSLFFGQEWRLSGTLAQYIALYSVVELLYISMDSIYYVLRREKRLFHFQLITFASRFLVLWVSYLGSFSFEKSVQLLVVVNGLLYCGQLSYVLRLLELAWWKHLVRIISLIIIASSTLYGIKVLFFWLTDQGI
ncbi:MAG: lipopolysaccharide biosynthesis protein [Cyclobacteriaceae bacterium]